MRNTKGFLRLLPYDKRIPGIVWIGVYSQMIVFWIGLFTYHNKIGYIIAGFTATAMPFLASITTIFFLCIQKLGLPKRLQKGFKRALSMFAQGIGFWLAFAGLSLALNHETGIKWMDNVYLSLFSAFTVTFFLHALTKIIIGIGGMVSTSAFKMEFE